jgi:2-iminobutanoate/2-iminopropanoate deaminase
MEKEIKTEILSNGKDEDQIMEDQIMEAQEESNNEDYLYFSSIELMEYFINNLTEKDIKTQAKRIFEMARVYMKKKEFELEDIYSVLVMMKNINDIEVVNEVFQLYFKKNKYPVRVVVQTTELEDTADIEMEFSAYRGEKEYILDGNKGETPESIAVKADNFIFCSGVGSGSAAASEENGTFKQRVKYCIDKLHNTLIEAGSDFAKTYSFMIYLKDEERLEAVEEVFAEYILDDEEKSSQMMKVEKMTSDYDIIICCSAYQ